MSERRGLTTYWSGQNFAADHALEFSYIWNTSAALAIGTYSVDIGVFDSTWAHNYYWNGSASSFEGQRYHVGGAPDPHS